MNSQITEVWQVRVKAQSYTQATLAAAIELKWNFPVLHIPLKRCLSFCLPRLCHLALQKSVNSRPAIAVGGSVWSQWTGSCADCCWIINPVRCESDTNEWFSFRGWWLLPDPPAVSSGIPSARKSLVSIHKNKQSCAHESMTLSDIYIFALNAHFFQCYCVL